MLQRGLLLIATAGAALMNGTHFSPLFDPVYFLVRPFAPGFVSSPTSLFYFTALLLALTTFVVAAVPAALYERARGLTDSTRASLSIWLVCTLILTLPTLMRAAGLG